ncbi:MinD/ParA family protein [Sporolactobacillus sp. THM7-4]|nr:MinD/ParA family protein [Sporolactobacillus sp. THM7-4]
MMNDQAASLREKMNKLSHTVSEAEVIGVFSGKGGVGKSVFSVNFSIALSQLKKRVLIVDLDIGMGNIEQLVNHPAHCHIADWIKGRLPLNRVIEEGPGHVAFISGGSGLQELFRLDEENLHFFLEQMKLIKNSYDYIIFDFGAGITSDTLQFVLAVHRLILITTPEPTAMADGYSALKMICSKNAGIPLACVVNQVSKAGEGKETWERLSSVCRRFIGADVKWLMALHGDPSVIRSVRAQVPCLLLYPGTRFSIEMRLLARSFIAGENASPGIPVFSSFLNKVRAYFKLSGGD